MKPGYNNETADSGNNTRRIIDVPAPFQSEARIQAEAYQWAYNAYPQLRGLLFSVPNGGTRNMREAQLLKATGTTAGVPDMLCLYERPIGIEFKTPTGIVSPAQEKIHRIWREHGIPVFVVRSVDEFKKIIERIVSHPGPGTTAY